MLTNILAVLKSRWFLSLVGAVLLAVLVWLFGPLLAFAEYRPLGSEFARFVAVMVILVVWGLANIYGQYRERRANAELMEGIAAAETTAPAAGDPASEEEVTVLREGMQDALAALKKSKLGGRWGRRYVYQLPWYIIIGPPGAGKTTALVNSGLSFPLADRTGKEAVRGVGGTRNCDWWFTDEAVLIDTAGRYTTQDSHQAVDSAGWTGFLDLLKKHRSRQPINGVLVAISLADLAILPEAERAAHARAIKQRIGELIDQLGVRFPIYVLFTKADLIAGFVEFFDDLGRAEREQVFGFTFPLDGQKGEGGAVAGFGREFDTLMERLNDRMIERLRQEADVERRSLIYGFPQQMATLRAVAGDFLDEIFRPSRLQEAPLLRGVYFTSGTQDGTPIDRLMGAMANAFGIGRQALTAFSGTGRSYFLTRPLRDVVFPEAGVVSANPTLERRRRWVRRGVYATAATALIAMTGVWLYSYQRNSGLVDRTEVGMADYRRQVEGLSLNAVEDPDPIRVLPALATLRALPGGYTEQGADVPLGDTFGLYQGEKLGGQAIRAYRHAINTLLLPRLLIRLEDQIRRNLNRPDFLYEALKVYLMLGRQGPLDPDLLLQWMALDWSNAYPGEPHAATRDALRDHLAAMVERPLSEIPLDGNLVEDARRVLTSLPLAERAYAQFTQSRAARQAPEWRIVDHGGAATGRVFVRRSGRPLSDGIEGLFTYDGFHRLFLPRLDEVARDVAGESWVLGPESEIALQDEQLERLERDVMGLYLDDYAKRWDALIADIAIIPFRSVAHGAEVTNILSGPNSPLRNLLTAIVRETRLTVPPEGIVSSGTTNAVKDFVVEEARGDFSERTHELSRIVEGALDSGGVEAPKPGQFIDDRYAGLHAFVGVGAEGPSQLDATIEGLMGLYRQLGRIASAPDQGGALLGLASGGDDGAAGQLKVMADQVPEPVSGWLKTVTRSGSSITVGGARSRLDDMWQAQVVPLCRAALEGRYPVVPNSPRDIPLDDFTRLLGPGGLIDAFFNTQLRPFVDTGQRPWRWQKVGNVDLGISAGVLAQFERAQTIRDALFPAGAAAPQVRFELTPASLDAGAEQALLDIDGQTVSYSHGPPRPVQLQWPGPEKRNQVRLALLPPRPGQTSTLTKDGPWSLFRLLDEARIEPTSIPERFTVRFDVGGRAVSYQLRANSVINPFGLKALEQFRCPASL